MINTYLNDLDAFISANDAVANVDVIRRDIRDTGLEKIALYRYRLKLKDGSIVELTERIINEITLIWKQKIEQLPHLI